MTTPTPKRPGRPASTPEHQRKVRAIRMNDARWLKLQRLGSQWLERAVDRAREPG